MNDQFIKCTNNFRDLLASTKQIIENTQEYIGLVQVDSPQQLIDGMNQIKMNIEWLKTYPELLQDKVNTFINNTRKDPQPLFMLPNQLIIGLDQLEKYFNKLMENYASLINNQHSSSDTQENKQPTPELILRLQQSSKQKIFWNNVDMLVCRIIKIYEIYNAIRELDTQITDSIEVQTSRYLWNNINKLSKNVDSDYEDNEEDEEEEDYDDDDDDDDQKIRRLYKLESSPFFIKNEFVIKMFQISDSNLDKLIYEEDNLLNIFKSSQLYQAFDDIGKAKDFRQLYNRKALEKLANIALETIELDENKSLKHLEMLLNDAYKSINNGVTINITNISQQIQNIKQHVTNVNNIKQSIESNNIKQIQAERNIIQEEQNNIIEFCNRKISFLCGIQQIIQQDARKYNFDY